MAHGESATSTVDMETARCDAARAAAAWWHGGVVLRPRPQRRNTTAMVRAGARRPWRTCVVAQRLRWHGVARRRGGEAVRAAGEAARAATLLASGRGMCVSRGCTDHRRRMRPAKRRTAVSITSMRDRVREPRRAGRGVMDSGGGRNEFLEGLRKLFYLQTFRYVLQENRGSTSHLTKLLCNRNSSINFDHGQKDTYKQKS